MDPEGGGKGGKPKISPNCLCGYKFKSVGEWCPTCWPDKQPKEKQLDLFGKEK